MISCTRRIPNRDQHSPAGVEPYRSWIDVEIAAHGFMLGETHVLGPIPAEEPAPAARLWYAFATHGGNPCSIYIGDWSTAFALAVEYHRAQGGTLHFVEVHP